MKLLSEIDLGDLTKSDINTFGLSVCHGYYEEGKGLYTIPDNIAVLQYSLPGRILQGLDARYIIKSILSGKKFDLPEIKYSYEGKDYYSPVKPFIYEPGDRIYNLSLKYREADQISKINAFIGLYSENTNYVDREGIADVVPGRENIQDSLGNLIDHYSGVAERLGYTSDNPFLYIQLSCKESIGSSYLMPFADVANSMILGFDSHFYSYESSIEHLTDDILRDVVSDWRHSEWPIDRKLIELTQINVNDGQDSLINDFLNEDYEKVFPYDVLDKSTLKRGLYPRWQ